MKKNLTNIEIAENLFAMGIDENRLISDGFSKKDVEIFVQIKKLETELLESENMRHHLKKSIRTNGEKVDFDEIINVEAKLLNNCSSLEVKFYITRSILEYRRDNLLPESIAISFSVDSLGMAVVESNDINILGKVVKYSEESMMMNLRCLSSEIDRSPTARLKAGFIASVFNKIGYINSKVGDEIYAIEANKIIWIIANNYFLTLEHPLAENAMMVLKKYAPEFSKIDLNCSLIVPDSNYAIFEDAFLVRAKIQKKILNPIQKATQKGAWSDKNLFGDYGVKGYIDDKYIVKVLAKLNSPKNIEIAKMLCLEAICVATLNNNKKDITCLSEFTKQNPDIVANAMKAHSEYFLDGSMLSIAEKELQLCNGQNQEINKIFEGTFIDLQLSAADQPYLLGDISKE
jgi:hypothetical protein